jgi:hypothetical protein
MGVMTAVCWSRGCYFAAEASGGIRTIAFRNGTTTAKPEHHLGRGELAVVRNRRVTVTVIPCRSTLAITGFPSFDPCPESTRRSSADP